MKGPLERAFSFATESEMAEVMDMVLARRLKFNQITSKREFRCPLGVPDFLLFRECAKTIAYVTVLELKLKNWRKGLYQAFKYRSYANSAYVALDAYHIKDALNNISLFEKFNIGLASIDLEGIFTVYAEPISDLPFSSYHASLLMSSLNKNMSDDLRSRFHRSQVGAIGLKTLESQ